MRPLLLASAVALGSLALAVPAGAETVVAATQPGGAASEEDLAAVRAAKFKLVIDYGYGADLGGPILPGTLHFFGAYEGTRQTNPSIDVVIPTGFGLDEFDEGQVANKFTQDLYFGKLTLFASDADR